MAKRIHTPEALDVYLSDEHFPQTVEVDHPDGLFTGVLTCVFLDGRFEIVVPEPHDVRRFNLADCKVVVLD